MQIINNNIFVLLKYTKKYVVTQILGNYYKSNVLANLFYKNVL